ncbi:MAG: hypothetical protein AMJ55_09690 [Gammaproteobacteria bacterium SG8_15]|nr:MAG: hypothetical protein AMJ55_09690 [Gammaproteobacteria bacterium SG8_15]
MTANEKSKQKLVETMRKTRAAAKEKEAAPEQKDAASKPVNVQEKVAKTLADRKAEKQTRSSIPADPYRSARRVWPD